MIRDADFCVTLIKQVLTEDPTKVTEAVQDYEFMLAAGVIDEGETRGEVMAEYVVHMMRLMNPHLPELVDALNANYDEIESKLMEWFAEQGY